MADLVTAKLLYTLQHGTDQCCHLWRLTTMFYEPLDYAAAVPILDHVTPRVFRAVDLRCNEGDVSDLQHLHNLLKHKVGMLGLTRVHHVSLQLESQCKFF